MSKKIKLMFMIIFLLLGIGKAVQAYTPAGYFPQRVEAEKYTYFCKEQGGPLRFFDVNTAKKVEYDWYGITYNSISDIESSVKGTLNTYKAATKLWANALTKDENAYIIQGSNYNGNFVNDPRIRLSRRNSK